MTTTIEVNRDAPLKLKSRFREKIREIERKDIGIWSLINELIKMVLEEAGQKNAMDIFIVFNDSFQKFKVRYIDSFAFRGLEIFGPVERWSTFPVYPSFIIGRGVGGSKKGREIRCLPKNSKEKIEGIYRILYRIAEY